MTEDLKKLRKKLDLFSTYVVRAYLDSMMFLTIVKIACSPRKSNFLFDYSYFSIRERSIISAKCLIEPQGRGKSKLTLDTIIKNMQSIPSLEQYANGLQSKYQEILKSDGAIRLKGFRDALCHNIEKDSERMILCQDLMSIIDNVIWMLEDIYADVFQTKNDSFKKIYNLAQIFSDDYWSAICEQADKMPNRLKELTELQNILNYN